MKDKKNKVMVAVPCTDIIHAKTAFSLFHTANNDNDFEMDLMMRIGCDIIGSRVWLVRQAMQRKATHILFVDHDMYFPPYALERLMDADKDIIGASYNFRSLPAKTVEAPLEGEDITKMHRCHMVGTGFLLIKLSVFEKIPEPWFLFKRGADGELVSGEDTYFCQEAIKAGFEVWCQDVDVKHLGEYQY